MNANAKNRRLAAIMFSDICGYSRIMGLTGQTFDSPCSPESALIQMFTAMRRPAPGYARA